MTLRYRAAESESESESGVGSRRVFGRSRSRSRSRNVFGVGVGSRSRSRNFLRVGVGSRSRSRNFLGLGVGSRSRSRNSKWSESRVGVGVGILSGRSPESESEFLSASSWTQFHPDSPRFTQIHNRSVSDCSMLRLF